MFYQGERNPNVSDCVGYFLFLYVTPNTICERNPKINPNVSGCLRYPLFPNMCSIPLPLRPLDRAYTYCTLLTKYWHPHKMLFPRNPNCRLLYIAFIVDSFLYFHKIIWQNIDINEIFIDKDLANKLAETAFWPTKILAEKVRNSQQKFHNKSA